MDISKELFYNNGLIFNKRKDETQVYYSKEIRIDNSIIVNGSYIEGKIENCIWEEKF